MMRTRCTLMPYVGLGFTRELSRVVRSAAPPQLPLSLRRCHNTTGSAASCAARVGWGGGDNGVMVSRSALLAAARAMTSLSHAHNSSSFASNACRGAHWHRTQTQIAAAALTLQARFMHVRDKPDMSHTTGEQAKAEGEQKTRQQRQEGGGSEEEQHSKTNNNAEGEEAGKAKTDEEEGSSGSGNNNKKNAHKRKKPHKFTFADHIRGLRADYVNFPDIYNSANAINFVLFTVFCLCSTGSNTEEEWWMEHWALDNALRPYNWLLHSFLTNNFLTMTYAMMMLHTMCHQMLPTIGSRNLLLYVAATAIISGAVMWAGNRFAYGANEKAREKQFGPWDVVSAMFVMQYLYFAISPVTTLNSFTSWMRYACWVGQICIMYFDWQPTFVGAAVGLALCKGVPRFRVKPMVS